MCDEKVTERKKKEILLNFYNECKTRRNRQETYKILKVIATIKTNQIYENLLRKYVYMQMTDDSLRDLLRNA